MAQLAAAGANLRLRETLARLAARWRTYLLTPIDGTSVALFRIGFGLLMLWEVWRYFDHGWIARYYIEPRYVFSFVSFVQPWPGQGMYWHFYILGATAMMMALGLYYRVASALFCLAFSYVFLLDKARYLNHFYLICLLSLLLTCIPAQRAWSLDRHFGDQIRPATIPRWCLIILRFQIVLVYLYGGIAKLNSDWLAGIPIGAWLADRADTPLIGPLLAAPWAGLLFAWSGLGVDLVVGLLLLWRRTFWLGLVVALLFHTLNAQIFEIGVFPLMMIAALVLFPRPDWLRHWRGNAAAAVLERTLGDPPAPTTAIRAPSWHWSATPLLVLLHCYVLLQVAVPLRHWLYPGDVAWTEEGHRFAWRMKLRDKDAETRFLLTDPSTGMRQAVDLSAWLNRQQRRVMAGRPDMIQQFAHHLADQQQAATGQRPIVTVHAQAALNHRAPQLLIDPTIDLAAQPRVLWPAPWIVPLRN